MNYSKLILVGCISAFVAITTSLMGVAGTIIGSVISSVLYNMLSEALEKPVTEKTFSSNFEWEIAYVFPLIVIAIIQLMLIFALLSEGGFLPHTFLSVFLSIQDLANDNLYRVLGCALLVMSIYPVVLKPNFIKKSYGGIIAIVGFIFLARGFVDLGTRFTNLYYPIFQHFDFPIAVIAFILLLYVIGAIVVSARNIEKEFKTSQRELKERNIHNVMNEDNIKAPEVKDIPVSNKRYRRRQPVNRGNHVKFGKTVKHSRKSNKVSDGVANTANPSKKSKINESSDKIQFESNNMLDGNK